jgi:arabinoxylan arabinofuranohydrolase
MHIERTRNHTGLVLAAVFLLGACSSSDSPSTTETSELTGTGGAAGTGEPTAAGGGAGTGGAAGTGEPAAGGDAIAIAVSAVDPPAAGTYDSATDTLRVVDRLEFRFSLPRPVVNAEVIEVNVKGTNNGTRGFRSWLVDGGNTTLSNQVTSASLGVPSGAFDISYSLTANGAASYLYFKGPDFATNIDDVTIASITVTYAGILEIVPPLNPFKPATVQDPATTSLVLTRSPSENAGVLGHNPFGTQHFTADPTALEFEGRLYVYGTHDNVEFDFSGQPVANAYNTASLSSFSSADLVNWTDHGVIDVPAAATWASRSWAPAVASKVIDGVTKFFLYFANGADGIGVLTADSPVGPWTDPIGGRLISRDTPNTAAADVPWLFDPSVLVDDDGTGYLYYGGGPTPADAATAANPRFSRVVRLGADMASLDGEPQTLDAPYIFEDNEINKIDGTYYYSYCTNYGDPDGSARIAYMTSSSPLAGFTAQGILFENPGTWFGNFYNNHHRMIQFKGAWYIIYHTTLLEERLYGTTRGYRSLNIDNLTLNADGSLVAVGTYAGVAPAGTLDPFQRVGATTMAASAGLQTVRSSSMGQTVLDSIDTGDWMSVEEVAFGATGAQNVTISLASTTTTGAVELWLDGPSSAASGTQVATVNLQATADIDSYEDIGVALSTPVTETHELFFVFRGTGYRVASWQFSP